MADESNTGPLAAVAGTEAEVKTPKAKKQRAPRRQKAVAVPVQAEAKATAAKSPAPAAKPRRYSEQERGEKLKLIGTQVTGGTSTLRDAIKNAGISEQTYYQWKRAAKAVDQKGEKPVPVSNGLADLVQLEEENQRLRKILAEKLRAENAELRKRLGLD
ncbi:transposase [Rhizobium lusitanum]|uniref:transposase n=1 Tax=Rhizobium lusitanum TaxID=293958 RepID=UPI00195CA533|nr:transposase [Rhizobium lusitanum]MBM7046051.1 transposase [Rhizobium lusitanum]